MIILLKKNAVAFAAAAAAAAVALSCFAQGIARESKPLYRDISVIVDAGHEAPGEYFKWKIKV